MRRIIAGCVALALILSLMGAAARETYPGWTARQLAAHEAAELLRAAGVEEEHEAIQAMKGLWWSEYVEAPEMSQDVPSCTTVSQDVPSCTTVSQDVPSCTTASQDVPSCTTVSQDAQAQETPIWDAVGISWEDYCTWCNTVQHEAGPGCTPEHQRDMAAVVWNRVRSDQFPNTVVEVICQHRQYNPAYVTDSLAGIDQSCIDAVDDVLSGVWTVPEDVVWQAQFVQGSYVYAVHHLYSDGYSSTTYICGG